MTTARTVKVLALACAMLWAPAAPGQKIEPGAFNHDFLLTSKHVAAVDLNDLDPGSPFWSGVWTAAPTTSINLMWKITATVNQEVFSNTSGTRVLTAQSVNDGATIVFRYSFQDPSQSDSIADVPRFHDALATAIPFSTADSSFFAGCVGGPDQFDMIHMGNPCNGRDGLQCCPVGMLFWRADKGTRVPPLLSTVPGPSEHEVLTANSPGTVHEVAETDAGLVFTWQGYDQAAKRWTVVVARPMVSPPPLDPPEGATIICQEGIVGAAPLPAAVPCTPIGNFPRVVRGLQQIVFANWDGGQAERNGKKFIGQWGDLLVE